MIGGALGALSGQWLPAGDPRLVGHGRHGGDDGRHHALPLTGMFFALELPHDLNATARAVGRHASRRSASPCCCLRRSILTEKLARRGQHIAREYSVDLFELMRVGEVMDTIAAPRPGRHHHRPVLGFDRPG